MKIMVIVSVPFVLWLVGYFIALYKERTYIDATIYSKAKGK